MPRLRGLIMAAAVAALAVGALGAPAAAVDPVGHLAVVNGIPGKAIDVCFNGQETRSNLRYGGKVAKTLPAGQTRFKIAIAAPGKCKGSVLVSENGILIAGTDTTYVTTAKAPGKILVFSNTALGTIDASVTDQSAFALRHAADLGDVLWVIQLGTPILPTASPLLWQKGDKFGLLSPMLPNNSLVHWVTKPGKSKPLAGPINQNFGANRRYESYLLGTTPANARIVTLVRKILPAP